MTLSRDIRELRLVKTREGYQEMAPEETGPQFSLLAAEFLQDVLRRAEPGGAEDVARPRQLGGRRARHREAGPRWWAPSPATTPSW